MPRSHPTIPMSIDEFDTMEHRLGWKHEYWGGAAQLSPASMAVDSLELDLVEYGPQFSRLFDGVQIRRIEPYDKRALIGLFVYVFDDAIEYIGYDDASYHQSAHDSIATLFGGTGWGREPQIDGRAEHSFVAILDAEIVAAIAVRSIERGPIVEPVMVHPAYQRVGLGTMLLATAIASMRLAGETTLFSRCHLGNIASLAWHMKNGFREMPNYYVASHRALHYRWQAKHCEYIGDSKQAEEMQRQAEHWETIMQEFEGSDKWDSGFLR